jgi:hypothetical protein
VSVEPGKTFCHHHDPARAEERRRAASRASRSKPSRELNSLKALLKTITDQVLAGDLETGPAAVANQLVNTRLRVIELERKIKETEALEERITRLEGTNSAREERWGA